MALSDMLERQVAGGGLDHILSRDDYAPFSLVTGLGQGAA
jgi:hypothetical protein